MADSYKQRHRDRQTDRQVGRKGVPTRHKDRQAGWLYQTNRQIGRMTLLVLGQDDYMKFRCLRSFYFWQVCNTNVKTFTIVIYEFL